VTFLLDVNVLIALIDPTHISHGDAHRWFEQEGAAKLGHLPDHRNRRAAHRGQSEVSEHTGIACRRRDGA